MSLCNAHASGIFFRRNKPFASWPTAFAPNGSVILAESFAQPGCFVAHRPRAKSKKNAGEGTGGELENSARA
jgi:hypothetical protein